MHNCKSARDSFIDLALDEMPPATSQQLMTELDGCRACRDEFAALRSTLHVSSQALNSAAPGEAFWPGYHNRLRQALLASPASSPALEEQVRTSNGFWLPLRAMLTASIRVPVPAAIALLLIAVSAFGLRSFSRGPAATITSVETRTVTVPVVQEKVITRVVYVERKNSRSRRGESDRTTSNIGNTFASAASESSGKTALNLVGFKPTDEVKLTIIKGSEPK